MMLLLAAALLVAAMTLLLQEYRIRVSNARVVATLKGDVQTTRLRDAMRGLSSLGTRYRKFYSSENLEQLRTIVQTAGFNPYRTMPIIIGARTISMIFLPVIGLSLGIYFGKSMMDVLVFAGPFSIIGIMGPRWILWFMRRRFNIAVHRGTPDAIDLLVVCSEAGMGLESGLEQVAAEMHRSNPPMARVLGGLLDDLRVLPDRREAFDNLSKRSTTEGLRRFGTMINQSLQYGTPLSNTLRAVAEELRRDRMIKLEERAHKLGAKLLLPMVMFMLPAMFIVMGASPFLHLIRSFAFK